MAAPTVTVLAEGWDGPCYRVRTSSFDVAFLPGNDEDLDRVENVDAEVRLPDGSCWSATFFTVAEVARLMGRWTRTGEYSAGSYFWCSDGVIVKDPGIGNMTRALAAIYDEGHHAFLLSRLEQPAE
jgi:hypothetical protein